jgi:4'-phosphopantetheinyl transferase
MLPAHPGFHFNVSHSGLWVVCATSGEQVGIDVEQVLPLDFGMVKEALTRQELRFFQGLRGNEQAEFFYSIWTQKESFLKCLGQGMNFPLSWINCVSHDDGAVIQLEDETHLNLHQYEVEKGYKLSVCSVDSKHDERVQHVKLQAISLS